MANEQSGFNPIENIKNLSVAERILIVEEIWDSIMNSNEEFPLSDEQKYELDKRLEAYNKNPKEIKPWSEVRDNIRKKL
jgi:putative addiction module component (TIGR02574 family)